MTHSDASYVPGAHLRTHQRTHLCALLGCFQLINLSSVKSAHGLPSQQHYQRNFFWLEESFYETAPPGFRRTREEWLAAPPARLHERFGILHSRKSRRESHLNSDRNGCASTNAAWASRERARHTNLKYQWYLYSLFSAQRTSLSAYHRNEVIGWLRRGREMPRLVCI